LVYGGLVMIKPLHSNVVIQVVDEETPQSGIVIVDTGDKTRKAYRAKVLAVGPEVEGIQAGDIVWVAPHSGIEISLDGSKSRIVGSDSLLGVEETYPQPE